MPVGKLGGSPISAALREIDKAAKWSQAERFPQKLRRSNDHALKSIHLLSRGAQGTHRSLGLSTWCYSRDSCGLPCWRQARLSSLKDRCKEICVPTPYQERVGECLPRLLTLPGVSPACTAWETDSTVTPRQRVKQRFHNQRVWISVGWSTFLVRGSNYQ